MIMIVLNWESLVYRDLYVIKRMVRSPVMDCDELSPTSRKRTELSTKELTLALEIEDAGFRVQ